MNDNDSPTPTQLAWEWLITKACNSIGSPLDHPYEMVRDLGRVAVHMVNDRMTGLAPEGDEYEHPEVSLTLDDGLAADAMHAARDVADLLGLQFDANGDPLGWPEKPVDHWVRSVAAKRSIAQQADLDALADVHTVLSSRLRLWTDEFDENAEPDELRDALDALVYMEDLLGMDTTEVAQQVAAHLVDTVDGRTTRVSQVAPSRVELRELVSHLKAAMAAGGVRSIDEVAERLRVLGLVYS